jgi:DNA recombination protein RmuC
MDPAYTIAAAIIAVILVFAVLSLTWRAISVIAALRAAKGEVERYLAVAEEKASRIPDLENSLSEKSSEADALRDVKASTEKELAATREALSQSQRRLESVEKLRDELAAKFDTATTEKSDLESKLADKTARLEEKTASADTLRQHVTNEFKVLADNVMRQHGESFKKQNIEQIAGILSPLRDKLIEFQQGLERNRTDSAKERATFAEQIRGLTEASAKMNTETQSLTQALRGKAQTQGAWGEMILNTILNRSGLREGEEYVVQDSRVTEEGSRLRPDVIVNLPVGHEVVVDSKVSLAAFYDYVNAETDTERDAHLSSHMSSIRNHIKKLSGKEYQQVVTSRLDFVIMFVPIEAALAAALQKDPDLTGFAAEKNIAIATPTTLMIALKTIANLWQVERRNKNAEAIADRAGKLYDKFVGFLHEMRALGDRLTQAQESYAGAMDKLSDGRGNLIRQVELLKIMGAKTGKAISPDLLDSDETEGTIAPLLQVET